LSEAKQPNDFAGARWTEALTWDLHEARVLLGAAAAARRRPVAGEHPGLPPAPIPPASRTDTDRSAKRAAAGPRRLPRDAGGRAPVKGEARGRGGGNGGGEGAAAVARCSVPMPCPLVGAEQIGERYCSEMKIIMEMGKKFLFFPQTEPSLPRMSDG